jgi:regulator of sigma E protease
MSIAMLGQFFLSLSLLIVLHECGHFFPAKWFKTRVEKFYLFFDPWFSLFKTKIGDTEYGIGWLPLGGYVKISGMVDESMDTEQLQQEPQPWEFRTKKAWQRLIIMLGGVTVNFILGFFVFGMLLWYYGEEYMPASSAKYGIYAEKLGLQMGLKTGDKILKVGNQPFDKFDPIMVKRALSLDGVKNIQLDRNGEIITLTVADSISSYLMTAKGQKDPIFSLPFEFSVDSIMKTLPLAAKGGFLSGCNKPAELPSPAAIAKLEKGDRIIAFDTNKVMYFNDLSIMLPRYKGTEVDMTYIRGNDTLHTKIKPTEDAKIGFYPKLNDDYVQTIAQKYPLMEALPKGFTKGMGFLGMQMTAFGKIFKGEVKASESVGGFIPIAKMFGLRWDWERFWTMTASLSLILAFMNLLPIPALDGGYVMFLIWEMITGKKVSDKFMEKAVTAGFLLLISLILIINSMDVIKEFFTK